MLDKTQTATVHVPAGDLYDAMSREETGHATHVLMPMRVRAA